MSARVTVMSFVLCLKLFSFTLFCLFFVSVKVGVLRWSLNTTDESQMPLTINCWPEVEGGGQINVSMEYELVRACWGTPNKGVDG